MSGTQVAELEIQSDDMGLTAKITVRRWPEAIRPFPEPRPSDVPPDIRKALSDWLESGR